MDVREKLVELLKTNACPSPFMCDPICKYYGFGDCFPDRFADYLIAHGVTVQECAYWQYIDDDVDEDNNIQAYCSACHAGDKHATKMIGKVPYCWKCGRKMMPPPKGE